MRNLLERTVILFFRVEYVTMAQVVISVLMKLAGGCPSLSEQLNVDAFLEQARSYDKASSSPIGWYIRLVASTMIKISTACHQYFYIFSVTIMKYFVFCLGMLKQANYLTLCLFFVREKSMSGQGANSTNSY